MEEKMEMLASDDIVRERVPGAKNSALYHERRLDLTLGDSFDYTLLKEQRHIVANGYFIACLIEDDFLLHFSEKPVGELILNTAEQLGAIDVFHDVANGRKFRHDD
jgi:hypothetical protein